MPHHGHLNSILITLILATSLPTPLLAQLPHPLDLNEVGVGSVSGLQISGTSDTWFCGGGISGAGDTDGDGVEEVLIGAPGNRTWAYGEAYWIREYSEVSGGILSVESLYSSMGTTFLTNEKGASLGWAVTGMGDFNGDDFDDFLITSNNANNRYYYKGDGTGAAYFVYGSNSAFEASREVNVDELTAQTGFTFSGFAPYDQCGSSASGVGDVNSDGLVDFICSSGGAIYLLFGSDGDIGIDGMLDLSTIDGTNGVCVSAPGGDRLFCTSHSGLGDANGDGIDDFFIGNYDTETLHLIFGSMSGLGDSGTVVIEDLSSDECVNIIGASYPILSSAGDVNGDGLSDFLVGSYATYYENDELEFDVKVFLVYGSESIGIDGSLDLSTMGEEEGVRIHARTENSTPGRTMGGAGDVNGDGYCDFLVGTRPWLSSPDSDFDEVYLVYGSGLGIGSLTNFGELDGSNGILIDDRSAVFWAGGAVGGVGDTNSDGISDFAIGATHTGPGITYLIHGQGDAPSATYRAFTRPGDAPRTGLGMIGDGSHTIPFSRCWVDYSSGANPSGEASLTSVTLTRSNGSIENLEGTSDIADAMWELATDREGWGSAEVRFKYLDSEISSMNETQLRVFQAPDPNGPWSRLPTGIDTNRNQITAGTTGLGFFAIAEMDMPVGLVSLGHESD